MISLWPELLLCKVDRQLTPFVEYLRSLGCSTAQLAEMLTICPHLLGEKDASRRLQARYALKNRYEAIL